MVISPKPAYCAGARLPLFWKVSETSAMPVAARLSLPAKITSSIERPRRCFALCSPIAQRMASTTLLLPQPLGPTTPVTPSSKEKTTRSANDLNPVISRRRIFMGRGSAQKMRSAARVVWGVGRWALGVGKCSACGRDASQRSAPLGVRFPKPDAQPPTPKLRRLRYS